MIEIYPTTRIAWWNDELRSLWEPRIDAVRKVYNDAELATVIAGMRRVFVYHIRSDAFESSYEFLRKNNLVYFPTNRSAIYQGFSHKHQPVKDGEPYMLYGVAVKAEDQEAGELFAEASRSGFTDHGVIGDLLGYPECCRTFFINIWAGDRVVDPIYESAMNSVDVSDDYDEPLNVVCHPYCNNMLRYFGVRITPHLACSFQCEETIKWGEEWVEVMRQIDPVATEWAIELLSMPMTWDCLKGIAVIDTPIFRGITNSNGTLDHKIVNNLGYSP